MARKSQGSSAAKRVRSNSASLKIALSALPTQCRLTAAQSLVMAEAASVALAVTHLPPRTDATLVHKPRGNRHGTIHWSAPSQSAQNTYADLQYAAEQGAYGVAIVVAHERDRYVTIKRLQKSTGADYMMWRRSDPPDKLVRLEVSGICGRDASSGRLREKCDQLRRGNLKRPGLAVVVKFSARPVEVLSEMVR